ncbi:hypothetical protein [Hamadaea tsunoensis]|uniref:hypothetical protein n=1 Tax=Hamadaea tsunoensis TaxID=53368 RepID=UPI0004003BC1|nr:hypothetical protein [Hamadaea tsunoensis]
MTWPVAELDTLRRLRVLHGALPGTLYAETTLAQPFDEVWAQLSDVERTFPGLVPDVRSIRHIGPGRVLVHGYSGLRAPFDLVLRPGWCLMQSRLLVFGMALAPAATEGTRFAYLAGLRLPGRRLLRPLHGRLAARTLHRFEKRFGDV